MADGACGGHIGRTASDPTAIMEHDNPLQNTSASNGGGPPAEGGISSDIAADGGSAALKAAGGSSLPVLSAEDLRKGGLSLLDLPSAAAGSDGGLMIDGFMVPPHVLQALKVSIYINPAMSLFIQLPCAT